MHLRHRKTRRKRDQQSGSDKLDSEHAYHNQQPNIRGRGFPRRVETHIRTQSHPVSPMRAFPRHVHEWNERDDAEPDSS